MQEARSSAPGSSTSISNSIDIDDCDKKLPMMQRLISNSAPPFGFLSIPKHENQHALRFFHVETQRLQPLPDLT